MSLRSTLIALALVLIAAIGGLVWLALNPPPQTGPAGVAAIAKRQPIGGPFTLVDHTGREVTEADFAGAWALIYFGFTYCPDICPTELAAMGAALDSLGDAGAAVQPLFFTVDPERDTPEQMAGYVSLFHPRLIGLTGTAEQVAEAARGYRVYYARQEVEGASEYLMDHSAFVYLVDPEGRLAALFQSGTAPQAMAAGIEAAMQAGGAS